MRSTELKKINDVLEEALAIDLKERVEFLDDLDLDEDSRREIESLLAFEEEAESALKLSAVEFSENFFETEDENSLIGQKFGAYKIIKELGYGGMGAVYLAERTDGKFSQKVALKLLKREMNTATLRRRFQQEREILATLEHPNIARLLNAGTSEDKIPFIAMEYVEGIPMDSYCNRNNLSLNKRLDLFRKVCSAVDFAHRNLIVHRDLKPSNILVTEDGTPKLLDFGISKILSEDLNDVNTATVTKMGVMTPPYASPEQLQKKSVSTATDIYSLGVILYELLSGHRPFEEKEDDLKEIYNAVLESEPPLPSALAETSSQKFKEITAAKTENLEFEKSEAGEVTEKLKEITSPQKNKVTKASKIKINPQSLKGDLDNIILKALKKEPERRYSSAENFATDIKRHQKGLPVTARPDTFSYRASKFIKRNRFGVGAGVLILLAIVGGIIATLWQARIAQAERAKAEKRFNEVRKIANSFLFEITPKIESVPGTTEARELLVKRALEYLDTLAQESEGNLELRRELAAAYEKVGDVQGNPFNTNIGDTEGALKSYEKALKIREEILAENPNDLKAKEELAQVLSLLGDVNYQISNFDKSEEFYRKSIALREEILKDKPDDFDTRGKIAGVLKGFGFNYFYQNDFKKAIEFYEKSQKIYEKLHKEKPDHKGIAQAYYSTMVNIGEALSWDGKAEEATENLTKGYNLLNELAKENPNDSNLLRMTMTAHIKLAQDFESRKNYSKGIEIYQDALEIVQRYSELDPKNMQGKRDIAIVSKKLAQAYDSDGQSEKSLEKLNFALEAFKKLKQEDPKNTEHIYDVANTQYALCDAYNNIKDFDTALKSCREAENGFNEVISSKPDYTNAKRAGAFTYESIAKSFEGLAEKGNRRENLQKALAHFEKAVEHLKKIKVEGKLSEYDAEAIPEIEEFAKKVKEKLG